MTPPAAGVDRLDLSLPVDQLTAALVDIPSVSGDEARIADLVENTLSDYPHLHVQRWGNVVVARTDLGRAERVVLAGHLDTVPIADNVPSHWDGDTLYGCGTTDMKSGVAVQLSLAAHVTAPNRDVTYVFYDCEEVEATRNGLGRLVNVHPLWLEADFAVLLEPTDGELEAGCQGTLRYRLHAQGRRAHSARSWRGTNAIHLLGPALDTLRAWPGREVEIDGCHYREGLNAVRIGGGVAGNVITDEAWLDVNFRFAPDRDAQDAADYVASLFPGYRLELQDLSPGALPGLHRPAAAAFVAAVGKKPRAKYGWTDVARFTTLGVPAVNFGPGDPNLAHTREEHVFGPQVLEVEAALRTWLTA